MPKEFEPALSIPLAGDGVAGLSVVGDLVVVAGRDILDKHDIFQCFNHVTGELLWQHLYLAEGELDYGNSPRATPIIDSGLVYTLGAFGHLCCIELDSGAVFWERNIAKDFKSREMIWGHSATPLIADGKLIVQPGGKQASLAALDLDTGETLWTTPGIEAGYSSLIAGTFGGRSQIIGYDAASLGGWDVTSGKRLWRLIPPINGDFNVPTVVPLGEHILVSTENNGTRRYAFQADGTIRPKPLGINEDLAPDSHTPVVSNGDIYGIWNELYGVNTETLKTEFSSADDAFAVYGSLIATDRRLLSLNQDAELLLIATDVTPPQIVDRRKLSKKRVNILSHPAVAGDYLFVRVGRELRKYRLR